MKHLINVIQAIVVIIMAYPVFYIWDTDRVTQFCDNVQPGISTKKLNMLVSEYNVTLITSTGKSDGRWQSSVNTISPFSNYTCMVKGVADTIAAAEIIEG